ncbi:MlaC/ttg2D family ABC transporter substrate-binding protein [Thalassotalea sediminis]|uniref:MlaC/ttg2D family ABC transporter substrate-binding protein n=1 Tax=Thalassotalea sediminis TaxID=1759089 RepID=UPI00257472FE|nr:ABC transporter substrate-binding protein [Thalassotalea sediminis]
MTGRKMKMLSRNIAVLLSSLMLVQHASASDALTSDETNNNVHFYVAENSGSSAINTTDPFEMIKSVADITFKRFANEQTEIRKNPNLLKKIVREELVPYIDYRYAAFKVIGAKNFKNTTSEERDAFVPVFLDYLVTSYAQVFTLYNSQEVKFEKARISNSGRIAFVKTLVIEPGREPIDISFSTRKGKNADEWKAYDMVAEGISMLDSKEAELGSLIRQKGLPHVTELLKEKAAKDIVFK